MSWKTFQANAANGYAGYTTKEIKCYPLAAAGASVSTKTTAWAWTNWTEIVPADTIPSDFIILALVTSFGTPCQSADTLNQCLFQIGVGASGAEVPIASLPANIIPDTQAGYPPLLLLPLIIPVKVPANSRISFRVATSYTTSRKCNGTKIVYIELPL